MQVKELACSKAKACEQQSRELACSKAKSLHAAMHMGLHAAKTRLARSRAGILYVPPSNWHV